MRGAYGLAAFAMVLLCVCALALLLYAIAGLDTWTFR